jgi:hypothetical protein
MSSPPLTTKAKLVTIIAASELWERLEAHFGHLGVRAYTFSSAGGHGEHGHREGGLLHSGNVRVEAVVRDDVAHAILQHLAATYPNFELTAYMQDVEALVRHHSA